MFCENCGTKLEPGAKSCPFCGASVSGGWRRNTERSGEDAAPVSPAPSWEPAAGSVWESASPACSGNPEPPKKSRRGLIAAVAAAAVLCVIAAAVFLRPGDPKAELRRAMEKSAAAYAEALEANPLISWQRGLEDYERSETLSLEITRVSDMLDSAYLDMDFLQGMGIRFSGELSRSSRSLVSSAVLYYRDEDLFHAQFGLEDTLAEIYLPELIDGQSLAFDTLTLGEDLARMGLTGMEELSFDFFDALDSAETPKPDSEAAKALLDAVQVVKGSKGSRTINGMKRSCDTYQVLIPKEALEDYLQASAEISAGLYSSASIQRGVRIRQDVELSVYVYDGYVAAVLWSGEVDGEALTVKLYLGGGDNYADNLSLEVRDESAAFLLSSTGCHVPRNGLVTDTTTLRLQNNGLTVANVSSDFYYDAGSLAGDLDWTLSVNDFTLAATGAAKAESGSLRVQLDDMSIQAYGGIELAGLKADLQAGPYEGTRFVSGRRMLLSDMTLDDLEFWAERIAENAQSWVWSLGEKIPDLAILTFIL